MQHQQEFKKQYQHQQPYQPQKQQYRECGRNTQQKQPQFGVNMSDNYQGWLWQTGAENLEQLNVICFCDTRPIPTPQNNNKY